MTARMRLKTAFLAFVLTVFLVVGMDRGFAGKGVTYTAAGKAVTHTPQEWLALAEAGDKLAQSQQCMIFSFGKLKSSFYLKAVSWCRAGAEDGDIQSEMLLGRIYAEGGGGVKRNIAESYFWLAISIVNVDMARTTREAAARVLDTKELAKAEQRISDWKRKFCAREDKSEAAKKARCFEVKELPANTPPIGLARAAFNGHDYKKAFALSLPLAEKGDAEAQFMVASMYHGKRAGELDWTKAGQWYRKSAEQGYAPAQFYLGQMLDDGIPTRGPSRGKGVSKDTKEAFVWYRKAADQKYVEAYTKISLAFRNGRDVPKDFVEAYAWQHLAYEAHRKGKGGSQAHADIDRMFLSDIAAKLSDTEQEAANRRARELEKMYLR